MIFIVSPAYNEEECIGSFLTELDKVSQQMQENLLLILVDDGSHDRTVLNAVQEASRLKSLQVKVIELSRNFGKEPAIQAGVQVALELGKDGDYFVLMDSDLQHSPSLISDLIQKLRSGIDHVQFARQHLQERRLSNFRSFAFYKLFNWLSERKIPEGADFRAFNYRFAKEFAQLNERARFNRGLFTWLGFKSLILPYLPNERTHGTSKYSTFKLAKLALQGIIAFSNRPLILTHFLLFTFSFGICSIYLIVQFVRFVIGYHFEPGWPTIIFMISFWGGLIALGNMISAIYIGQIFEEVKRRPSFIIRKIHHPEK